jgi:hypothetical protein
MFVAVRLNVSWGRVYTEDFWRTLKARQLDADVSEPTPPDERQRYEAVFRAEFPSRLEKHVNEEFRRTWEARGEGLGARAPQVKIRLASLRHGSLRAILDVIGITDSDLRSFVLMTLEMYSPIAFEEVMGFGVPVVARARVIGDEPPISAPVSSGAASVLLNNSALLRSLTSFLIPIALVFVICFFVFNALTHELSALKVEAAAVRTERTEILKAVVDQNKSISASLTENSKAAMASTKALEELLVSLITKRAAETGAATKP